MKNFSLSYILMLIMALVISFSILSEFGDQIKEFASKTADSISSASKKFEVRQ